MDTPQTNPFADWRRFLAGVVVVALGVLAALGLWTAGTALFSGHGTAAAATARIEPELRANMEYLAERSLVARCVGRQLDVLEGKVLAAKEQWTPITPVGSGGLQAGNVISIPLRQWHSAAWAATDPAQLDDARRGLYTQLYETIGHAARLNGDEYDAVARLSVLTKPVTLSSDRIVEIVELIEAERARNRSLTLDAFEAFQAWQKAGRDTSELVKAVRQTSPLYKACFGARKPAK